MLRFCGSRAGVVEGLVLGSTFRSEKITTHQARARFYGLHCPNSRRRYGYQPNNYVLVEKFTPGRPPIGRKACAEVVPFLGELRTTLHGTSPITTTTATTTDFMHYCHHLSSLVAVAVLEQSLHERCSAYLFWVLRYRAARPASFRRISQKTNRERLDVYNKGTRKVGTSRAILFLSLTHSLAHHAQPLISHSWRPLLKKCS
jgi:hypothetical protein